MKISLIQTSLAWENAEANRNNFTRLINTIEEDTDLILLPEMFATGFTMEPDKAAEGMDGETLSWMKTIATKRNCAITGSLVIEDKGHYYNRLFFVKPDGAMHMYDKRHLFSLAVEDKAYTPGSERLVLEYKGWKICPLVCYDLRFPVFSRNRYDVERPEALDYDLALYVANWPAARDHAWKTLLRARAIENLCYVAGLNRVGEDGNRIRYNGDSAVIDFLGHPVTECADMEVVTTSTLLGSELARHRQKFPAMLDGDRFELG
mgnify:CR=1 FL=1